MDPHNSMQVGGGDNASFASWFFRDQVEVDGVPFLVRRKGNDVLVSPNNTQNVFEITGFESSARAVHFLVWGYNYPSQPARIRIRFSDGTSQECAIPLVEWTQPVGPVAFDFRNTARFQHAAVYHRSARIDRPDAKVCGIESTGGTYGLIAVTFEVNR